ncbi:MAG TPA: hypothetical protein VG937_26740 [Polyangiaceae bacterium]|nr:hypothetical protein [Polyangiaceae bacterium]
MGDTESFALDVSGDGRTVVGRSSVQTQMGRIETPFLWTRSAGILALGPSGGRANATNSDGSVVVGATAAGRLFRWTAGKNAVDLGIQLDAGSSIKADTSDDGALVVGYSTAGPVVSAFRWTAKSGVMEALDASITSVVGVSRDGTLLVGSRKMSNGQVAAFRWTQGTGFVDLAPSGSTETHAQAMTSDAQVVLGWGMFGGARQLFRWLVSSSTTDFIGIPPAIADATVYIRAMSDLPQMFACYTVPTAAEHVTDEDSLERLGTACLGHAQPASAPRGSPSISMLADTLINLGVNLSGWQLTRTAAIASDGKIVVGNGIDPAGHSQAWIARLP